MTKTSKIAYFFTSCIFFIVFNLFLTSYVMNFSPELSNNSIISFVLVKNNGAAFNILEGARVFLITFSILAAMIVMMYTLRNINKLKGLIVFSSALLNAGILCNMYERLTLGYVRDFIKLNFIDFPVFNISDIYINISVFVIVFIVVKNTYFKNNETDN